MSIAITKKKIHFLQNYTTNLFDLPNNCIIAIAYFHYYFHLLEIFGRVYDIYAIIIIPETERHILARNMA